MRCDPTFEQASEAGVFSTTDSSAESVAKVQCFVHLPWGLGVRHKQVIEIDCKVRVVVMVTNVRTSTFCNRHCLTAM